MLSCWAKLLGETAQVHGLCSRVPSFHHGASGRSWHRPWRHRRTADSCPATAAWAPARSKMGTAQMVRRLARIKRMWHVIRWNPPNQWCHPSLDLGRTASISPFNLTEICRHWANHWKYWKLDVDIIIWDFQKKQSPMNSHSWTPMVGHKDLRIQPKELIYQWCVYRCLHDSGAPHRFFFASLVVCLLVFACMSVAYAHIDMNQCSLPALLITRFLSVHACRRKCLDTHVSSLYHQFWSPVKLLQKINPAMKHTQALLSFL